LFYDLLGKETFYIADFYCHEKLLAVELDGDIHKKLKEQDMLRDEVIKALGIRIVRIANIEVLGDIDKVMKHISAVLE